jgi:hypothetical protein
MEYPSSLAPLFLEFSLAFSAPTYQRWEFLMACAILTWGRRTISNLLRTLAPGVQGDPSSYHRVFSTRQWSLWTLGRALCGFILRRWVPDGPVRLAGDDTVTEHRGPEVYGKGRHRDAVRSSHSFIAHIYGHKWVVLSIVVPFPFASRPWALPVLVALYRTEEWNRRHGRRHRTPPKLARQLLCVLMRWFPERCFMFLGDGGFSPHESAVQAQRYASRLTLVGRFHPQASLYAPPPTHPVGKPGRPRKKGAKQPSPEARVKGARKKHVTVSWYGGGSRKVAVFTDTGWWYRGGAGLVEVRWVYVHDLEGTHRDEYFFSTAVRMTAEALIDAFTQRWSIEVTFEEARAHLGLKTARGWSERTVLRTTPCLFGLFSVVALMYAALPEGVRRRGRVEWRGKGTVTFSDALTALRRWMWSEGILKRYDRTGTFSKLPGPLRAILLTALARTG